VNGAPICQAANAQDHALIIPDGSGGAIVAWQDFRFALPSPARVSAQVLDLAGHRVRTLATEREFSAGTQTLAWDGRNDSGAGLPAGVYFARVRLGARSESRRVILLH